MKKTFFLMIWLNMVLISSGFAAYEKYIHYEKINDGGQQVQSDILYQYLVSLCQGGDITAIEKALSGDKKIVSLAYQIIQNESGIDDAVLALVRQLYQHKRRRSQWRDIIFKGDLYTLKGFFSAPSKYQSISQRDELDDVAGDCQLSSDDAEYIRQWTSLFTLHCRIGDIAVVEKELRFHIDEEMYMKAALGVVESEFGISKDVVELVTKICHRFVLTT